VRDSQDYFNENDGLLGAMGHMTAISQRNRQITQQKEHAEALRKQAAVMEAASRIETDRAKIERQRLAIEQQRLQAEEAQREMRRHETKQVKLLRNLMADSFAALERLEKVRPVL
jgi:hypothetical protein